MKYVYLVRAGEGNYKVGVASNIMSRVKALQTSNSQLIEVVAAKQTPNAQKLEKALHERLARLRHNGGREWFNLSPEEAIKVAIKINQSPGITVSEVQVLADLIAEQNERQRTITGRMQALVDQARAESIIPKPKIVKEYIDRAPKVTDDVVFENAVRVILEKRKASTSLLQRELAIGYGRAARIMEQLEGKGYITPPDGSHAREVVLLDSDGKTDTTKRMLNDIMSVT